MSFLRKGSSCPRTVVALLVLMLCTKAGAELAAQQIRPAVTLRLFIDATHYRENLDDAMCENACKQLAALLVDSVRAVLQTAYPFIDWASGGQTEDTVAIFWKNWPPVELQRTRLEFRTLGGTPRMKTDKYSVAFENIDDFAARQALDGWKLEKVRDQWTARLRSIVEKDADLLAEVFGRIPLKVKPEITKEARAIVPVKPGDLRVPETIRPRFSVEATVLDSVAQTEDDGTFSLAPCLRAVGQSGYSCSVAKLHYTSAGLDVSSNELLELLNRATITTKALFVIEVGRGRGQFHGAVFNAGGTR